MIMNSELLFNFLSEKDPQGPCNIVSSVVLKMIPGFWSRTLSLNAHLRPYSDQSIISLKLKI